MTALILLAAGMGKRLAGVVGELPKVLVPLPGGETLLARNITNALGSGAFDHVVVVSGHRADVVGAEVAAHAHAPRVDVVHNPMFASHGPIRSLLAAAPVIRDTDVAIANGDTFYSGAAFAAIARRGAPGFGLACSRRAIVHDDVKVRRAAGRVLAVGKGLDPASADGVSAGLFAAAGDTSRAALASAIERLVAAEEARTMRPIWHDVVNDLAQAARVDAVEVPHEEWREVDTVDDYAALRAALEPVPGA